MPRRWPLSRLLFLALWAVILVKAAPHLGAVFGIENGERREPAYQLTSLTGEPLSPAVLRGRVVLVNFWATWCLPCRVEMPALEAMSRRLADRGFVVVGLSVDRGPTGDVATFLRERGIDYPVAVVGPEVERAFGGVGAYPTSFLLDRAGRIRHRAVGPLAMASFEPAARRLLAEPSPP